MRSCGISPICSLLAASAGLSWAADPSYPICQSKANFAKTIDGRYFDFNGTGTPKYFAGTNTWWLSQIMSDADVDTVLSEIKKTQLQITRVWGFSSVNQDPGQYVVWFQLLNSTGSYINYADNGIPRLDAAVSYAEKHNVKLVVNFVNNWGDLGGIPSYNTAFGGDGTTWYTDATSQKVYRDYIELLVNRYKCSPAIFAWELANEPRCHGCPTSTIYDWAKNTSSYIKHLDPNHMVTLGDEGWFGSPDNIGDGSYAYGGGEGVDFVLNLGIDTLDYGTFHLYPDSWNYNETWGSTWIKEHDTAGAAVGKPVVLEEYGGPQTAHDHASVEGPWQDTVLKDTKIAADQFWQFATINLTTGNSQYDVNAIWYNDTEYTTLAREHAAAMLDKAI
ncbi:hypothetical protein AAFC00_004169 [Neodothiora populina]|uniref:mannan endo-1,4-beta-mannosidase n=1 Tax=Neodothiora populina TaxID=2781224 RepID=A0ABR3PIT3_9PEZI